MVLFIHNAYLLALIDKGLASEEAYDTVQPKAMEAWEKQVPFRTLIEADEKITSKLITRRNC